MKRKTLISLPLFLSILLMNSALFGQNIEEKTEIKVFGLGMHIEQYKLTDNSINISTAPANKIIFTISPTKNFRLEPEIGFNYLSDKENKLKDKSINIGIGGFYMFQRGKTNIYGGLRFEYAKISNEYISYMTLNKQTERTNRLAIGPAIGAEFFLGTHFSIGGEIGFKYMNLNSKENQYSDENIKNDYISTDSGLLLRFYF